MPSGMHTNPVEHRSINEIQSRNTIRWEVVKTCDGKKQETLEVVRLYKEDKEKVRKELVRLMLDHGIRAAIIHF